MSDADRSLSEEGAKTAFQLAWSTVSGGAKALWKENAVQRAMLSYFTRYLDRHGHVKILGMSAPVPLRDIYTPVHIVSPQYRGRVTTPDQLDREARRTKPAVPVSAFGPASSPRRSAGDLGDPSDRQPGLTAANLHPYLNVLGAPGAGKSTFLRSLGLEALLPRRTWQRKSVARVLGSVVHWSQYDHEVLPVLVELRQLRSHRLDLLQLLEAEFVACGFAHPNSFIEAGLANGKFLVLLDGLDEIPRKTFADAVSHVSAFVDRHPKNRYVISCRTAAYHDYFRRFVDVEISSFDRSQIRQFIHLWFSSPEQKAYGKAEQVLDALEKQPGTRELAGTPLLLLFICLVAETPGPLPESRALLYKEAFDILATKWSASKLVEDRLVRLGLRPELELELLSFVAARLFTQDKLFFTEDELASLVGVFLKAEEKAPQGISAHDVIDVIAVQQGLLVARASSIYSFSHTTIHEYLAARYFTIRARVDHFLPHLFEERWREIFLLLAGMQQADDLLVRMALHARRSVPHSEPLARLVTWAGDAIDANTSSEAIRAARRAIAVWFALYLLGQAPHLDANELGNVPGDGVAAAHDHDWDLLLTIAADLAPDQALHVFLSPTVAFEDDSEPAEVIAEDGAGAGEERDTEEDDDVDGLVGVVQGRRVIGPRRQLDVVIDALDELGVFVAKLGGHDLDTAAGEMRDVAQIAFLREILELDDDVASLGGSLLRDLRAYVRAQWLIVECKRAALSVTKSAWADVCRSLVAC